MHDLVLKTNQKKSNLPYSKHSYSLIVLWLKPYISIVFTDFINCAKVMGEIKNVRDFFSKRMHLLVIHHSHNPAAIK